MQPRPTALDRPRIPTRHRRARMSLAVAVLASALVPLTAAPGAAAERQASAPSPASTGTVPGGVEGVDTPELRRL
ncbi:MAG: hypothetical protein M3Q47_16090, partial [Actinomycetota bacterium]|nr:hypothetical protein [Actinomycetota bacterium]